MMSKKQLSGQQEEQEICFLREWLSQMSIEKLLCVKGASKALLYAQDNQREFFVKEKDNIK